MDWPRLQVSRGQSEHLCCCSESSTEAIFLQSSPLASRCLVTRWWKTLMVCPNLLSVKKKQKPDSVSFPLAENQMKQLKGIFHGANDVSPWIHTEPELQCRPLILCRARPSSFSQVTLQKAELFWWTKIRLHVEYFAFFINHSKAVSNNFSPFPWWNRSNFSRDRKSVV